GSEEHTSELQSRFDLVCRLLLEKQKEAVLLGFALAIDAFGAGLGAAMLGYSAMITACSIALMSGLFVLCGVRMVIFLSAKKWIQQLTLLPPFLLMILGILNMI